MRVIRAVLLVVFACAASVSFAQHNLTKEADEAYDNQQYFNAVDLYKQAFSKESKKDLKIKIIYRIGECYRFLLDYEQAEEWYEKAERAKYDDVELELNYAMVLKMQGKYEDALAHFKEYQQVAPSDPRAQEGINSCQQAIEWQSKPTNYVVENVPQLNSKFHDFTPAFADARYKTLMFASSRPGSTGSDIDPNKGQAYTDIFQSKVDRKGKWSTPRPLDEPINTKYNDGAPSFAAKGKTMYFTRCETEKNRVKACLIYTSDLQGTEWNEPAKLSIGTDTFAVGHPSMSKKNDMLFFASDMPGGQGGKDIYYMPYDAKKKEWGEPVNVQGVNTAGDEMYPFIHDDGRLFFASNGHPGMGGLDIFQASKIGPNMWGKVDNMRAPINGPGHDFGIVFEGNKNRGFFSSIREDGKGYSDIYSFKMPPIIFVLQGKVKDVECGKPVPNAVVKLIGTDGSSAEAKTDQAGFYKFDAKENEERYLSENTSYTIVVSKQGSAKKTSPDCNKAVIAERSYLNGRGQETTIGIERSTAFVHDFELRCSNCGEIKFPKVLYPLAKWDLLVNDAVNSKDSLDYLYQTLVENPTIVIELAAHTDARDTDARNQILSQKRAQTCVDYLISKGIEAERMVAKGYGESQPFIDTKTGITYTEDYINSLPKDQREAAHQINRRTVFFVLRDDYVPKTPQGENN
jgi:peptidoglycan-associated lipoprotein